MLNVMAGKSVFSIEKILTLHFASLDFKKDVNNYFTCR